MCTNKKWIWIDHGRKKMLVNCGHCPACLQEKAEKRAVRIRNSVMKGYRNLFITLTYCDECVPYILRDDLLYAKQYGIDDIESIPVYRDSVDFSSTRFHDNPEAVRKQNRKFFYGKSNFRYYAHCKRTYGTVSLRDGKKLDFYSLQHSDLNKLKPLYHSKDSRRIGVIYYPDLQNFFKRLRINLSRYYGITENFVYYGCSEYGPTHSRPHFHIFMSIPDKDYNIFKAAIVKSWTYDNNRVCQYVEDARNSASYVSSYVNCDSYLPLLFRHGDLRPKHSFSPSLGFAPKEFSLYNVVQKIRSGNLTYTREITRNGVKTPVNIPIPKYVINRYFPKYKGFNRLTCDETLNLLLFPQRIYENETASKLGLLSVDFERLRSLNDYTDFSLSRSDSYECCIDYSECDSLFTSIYNKTVSTKNILESEYNSMQYVTFYDYCFAWSRVWPLYSSTILKCSHEIFDSQKIPLYDYYDNTEDYYLSYCNGETLPEFFDFSLCFDDYNRISDPNYKKSNLIRDEYLTSLYNSKNKSRKIINFDMVHSGHNV